ncbi:MAG: amidase, partial [Acidobacteriota bacterium]|nr:amidase [Acidobacteriota bacterium]
MAQSNEPSTLREQARMIADGEASSTELVELALARIDATQQTLNAFRAVCAEEARAGAREADAQIARGERAPLLGVPVAIKDDVDLAGYSTPFGTAGEHPVARHDSEAVARLRAAGAVIVGKTTTCEYGQWPISESSSHGQTRNPWALGHTPGGSSGGSAAAVAAGVVSAAVGSDGAGSVRIPAAWCHLVGVKPQRGRISTWPEVDSFNGLTCIGPLARTVDDAALMLDVLAGNHPGDRDRPPAPRGSFVQAARSGPERMRIGLALRAPFVTVRTRLHPAIRAATVRMAARLEELGHEVTEISLPYTQLRYALLGAGIIPRGTAGVGEWLARHPDPSLLDPRTREWGRFGRVVGRRLVPLARRLERPYQRLMGR